MQLKHFFRGLVGAAALAVVAFPAAALNVIPAGGTGPKPIYQLDNGNFLGLVGLHGITDKSVTRTALNAEVASSTSVKWYFANPQTDAYGTKNSSDWGAWQGTPNEFTDFTDTNIETLSRGDVDDLSASSPGTLWDALWVEFGEGGVTFNGRSSFGKNPDVNRGGDPISAVPLPAGLPLMATMIAGFAAAARARKRA